MHLPPRRAQAILQRRSHATKPSGSSRAWGFLNSSFGVFLLSSVFLGFLSFSYSQWRDYKSHQQKMEQLDIEIAWRLRAMDEMGTGPDNIRYSNLANISEVINGNPKGAFFIRKPIFNEFQNKGLPSLLWQLYLVAPGEDRAEIKNAIRGIDDIVQQIQRVRYAAAASLSDAPRPKTQTKAQQIAQDDEDDKLKKDFGQSEIYRKLHALAQSARWKQLAF